MRKALAVLLSFCLLLGGFPLRAHAEEVDEQSPGLEGTLSVSGNDAGMESDDQDTGVYDEKEDLPAQYSDEGAAGGNGTMISRVQWLHELTTLFEMSVQEENYPDNYYSDMDITSPYYHDVMLATEFGLVDVEAGEPFRPEEPVTREFAAHTLNLCLGFVVENEGYTYSDVSETAYAPDIQVAINRGWFQQHDGCALPKEKLTVEEKENMLSDAAAILESVKIDSSHNNLYEFAEGVIVIPEGTVVELKDNDTIIVQNCPVALQPGNLFAIVTDGLPIVRKVVSVTQDGGRLGISTESVDMEEAFKSIDIQGSLGADLAQTKSDDPDASVTYIVGGTEENDWEDGEKFKDVNRARTEDVSAVEVTREYEIPEAVRNEYDLGDGVKATVSYKVSNVKADYGCTLNEAFLNVSAKVTFSCNVSIDVLEGLGVLSGIPKVKVPVMLIGYWELGPDIALKGNVTAYMEENVTLGVQYSRNNGFRLMTDFSKKQFSIQAKAEGMLGLKAAVGFDIVALKGSLYAKMGIKAKASYREYREGSPQKCSHVTAYFYANVGGSVSISLLSYKKEWKEEFVQYDEKSSPVRVMFHWEDNVPVSRCTRGATDGISVSGGGTVSWKYYTPANSRYGYNGASGGIDSAGEPYTIFEYDLDKAGNAIIKSYQGNVTALSIPDSLDGHVVTGIGQRVFERNTQLHIVVIPDSVTKIEAYAFANCTNLSSVTLSKGVTYIGRRVFENCDKISSIEIPRSLETTEDDIIGEDGVFANCDGLKTVTFEKGTSRIARTLFANCPGLEQITIPSTVTAIDQDAFRNCINLKKVVIPESVTVIRAGAFERCSKLSSVVIPDSVIGIEAYAFANCTNLSSVTLSKSVTYMGYRVFENCDKISSIEIPRSLETTEDHIIGEDGVFANCDGLKTVTFEKGTSRIAQSLFANCSGLEQITIPSTVTAIDDYAFRNCINLKKVVIPESVTVVGASAFERCSKLSSVVIPDSVTRIEAYAFANCTNLSSVTLSKGVTYMGRRVFENCDKISSIEIPRSLEKTGNDIVGGDGVFANCDGLKTVTFEKGTSRIAQSLFANCPGLEQITIPSTVTAIDNYAFRNCINLKKVVIPESVTVIGASAFKDCSKLPSVVIPDGVTSIGDAAFSRCTNLSSANWPKGVTTIVDNVFSDSGLVDFTVPDWVTRIEENAFKNCTKLASIKGGANVERIGGSAFYNCDSLTSVTISDKTTAIGWSCFADCQELANVKLGMGLTDIPAYAFDLCPALQEIVLPYRVATVQNNAFTNCTSLKKVTVPRATTNIGTSAFSYPTKMTIYGIKGTYAEQYAGQVKATFVNQEIPATSVTLKPKAVTVNRGEKTTIVMTITPHNFTDQITWKSSDASVATVSDVGVVTALKVGTSTIRMNVGKLSASCIVTVVQPVTNIWMNNTTLSLDGAQQYQLTAQAYPSDANNKAIVWSSENDKIAKVDNKGLVTAVSKGTVKIIATAADGSGVSKSCTVTVTGSCKKVSKVSQLASNHPYDNNCADSWMYTLSGASGLNVKFSSKTELENQFDFLYVYDKSNKQVGCYTGKELAGKTIFVQGDTVRIKLVSDEQGNAYGFAVESVVKAAGPTYPVTAVSFTYPSSLYVGETYNPAISVTPGNATNKTLTWKSSNPDVISVDGRTGAITVKAVGTVTITATAYNGISSTQTLSSKMLSGQYIGNINSELISFDLKRADNGSHYLTGQIVVVEWVNGQSTVPKAAPVMTFKSTDGKENIEVFVTPTGTNTYYFDRFIEGLTSGREYVFEIASGDVNNVSVNRSMNVSIATSPRMVQIKNLGKIGEQKISYYMASNGEMRLYRRTKSYVGNINSQLMKTALVTGPNGNYVSGEIVVVEWEDGISTVPFETPIMYFKSTDGKEALPVWVTPTGTNTYYFDRSLGDLDTGKEYIFTIESGDGLNVSRYKSMVVTTADMPSKEGTLWESPRQYVKYRTDPKTGQLRIYGVNK